MSNTASPIRTEDRVWKDGRELVIGDVYQSAPDRCHTITEFREHPGMGGDKARVLQSGPEWGITVFDKDRFVKTCHGTWCLPHLLMWIEATEKKRQF